MGWDMRQIYLFIRWIHKSLLYADVISNIYISIEITIRVATLTTLRQIYSKKTLIIFGKNMKIHDATEGHICQSQHYIPFSVEFPMFWTQVTTLTIYKPQCLTTQK